MLIYECPFWPRGVSDNNGLESYQDQLANMGPDLRKQLVRPQHQDHLAEGQRPAKRNETARPN